MGGCDGHAFTRKDGRGMLNDAAALCTPIRQIDSWVQKEPSQVQPQLLVMNAMNGALLPRYASGALRWEPASALSLLRLATFISGRGAY